MNNVLRCLARSGEIVSRSHKHEVISDILKLSSNSIKRLLLFHLDLATLCVLPSSNILVSKRNRKFSFWLTELSKASESSTQQRVSSSSDALTRLLRFPWSAECVFVCTDVTVYSNSVPPLYVFTIVTGNCVIHHPHWALWVTFCRRAVFCLDFCVHSHSVQNKMHSCFCLPASPLSISTLTSLVNEVHSFF